jgi:hypothetical protein
MSDDEAEVEDLTMAELQRERLRSARERAHYLGMIASHSRWTAIILAAHAGVGVLQDPPSVPAAAVALLALGVAVLPGRLWRR